MKMWVLFVALLASGCCEQKPASNVKMFEGPEGYHVTIGTPVKYRCFNCGVEEVEYKPVRRGDGTPLVYTCGKCWDAGREGMMRPVEEK